MNPPAAQVKLVIWDLDETLWSGVLGEGDVTVSQRRIAQLRELVDRGIMVSISSRNDEAAARSVLDRHGLWDLVIVPRINWESKGAQIRDLIEACRLRPANVLFVDDNHLNRQEAVHFAEALQVADPAAPGFDDLIDAIARAGTPDPDHRRLADYRLLERRAGEAVRFDSNIEFLRSCDITAELRPVEPEDAERLLELILRTNQLNYTKRRVDARAIRALLVDPAVDAHAVHVRDRFGDYGLVGFAAVHDGRVEHLAFSCRILGMAVERAVYDWLGRPAIDVVEPVRTSLDGEAPDWVTVLEVDRRPARSSVSAVTPIGTASSGDTLFVGGCDVLSAVAFLAPSDDVVTHVNYSPRDRPGLTIHRDSIDFLLSDEWPAGARDTVLADAPFLDDAVFDLPDWRAFRHIVYSPLIDYVQAKYARADLPAVLVSYGDVLQPAFDEARFARLGELGLDVDALRAFARRWSAVEKPDDVWAGQLGRLFERMRHADTVTILLGATETYGDLDVDRVPLHRRANALIADVAARYPNVHLVDVDRFIHEPSDFADSIRHYSRRVYRDLATELTRTTAAGVQLRAPRPEPAERGARRGIVGGGIVGAGRTVALQTVRRLVSRG